VARGLPIRRDNTQISIHRLSLIVSIQIIVHRKSLNQIIKIIVEGGLKPLLKPIRVRASLILVEGQDLVHSWWFDGGLSTCIHLDCRTVVPATCSMSLMSKYAVYGVVAHAPPSPPETPHSLESGWMEPLLKDSLNKTHSTVRRRFEILE